MGFQTFDSEGRDKALGQISDTVQAFVSTAAEGERERRLLLRLITVFTGIAATGGIVAAVAALSG